MKAIAKTYIKHDGERFAPGDLLPDACVACLGADNEALEIIDGDEVCDLQLAAEQLDPDNEDHWTKDGRPDVRALSDVLDRKVSAKDRNKIWPAK